MLEQVRTSLKARFEERLVDELLEAYEDAKRRFHAGDLGPNAVAGGRFCEAAFRILQEAIFGAGKSTPLGQQLTRVDQLMGQLAQSRSQSPVVQHAFQQDSIGLHIPRALRVIYDVRNNRDAAHLGDNIDPNQQDATLVVSVIDWVLAELLRLFHNVSADRAQRIVQDLVTRTVPTIQDFDGFPRVLKTGLQTHQYLLILLYHFGARGAQWHELIQYIPPRMKPNLQSNLRQMDEDHNYIHFHRDTGFYEITANGLKYVDEKGLVD